MISKMQENSNEKTFGNCYHILIASAQVPFTSGGAEMLAEMLRRELSKRGYTTDIVQLPFSANPKNELIQQAALWRSLNLNFFAGKSVDLVICTKFPSYFVPHPNKVLWLVHQHRQLYELYGSRFGDFKTEVVDESVRQLLMDLDRKAIEECQSVYTISENVSSRLNTFLGLKSEALLPPLPMGERYHSATAEPYILSVGRLCSIKRVDLLIKAVSQMQAPLTVKIVGLPDEDEIESYLNSEIEKHAVASRVQFLGRVSEDELLRLFAHALGVYYAPFDEDYGFVTLEALKSGKPVITAHDSGGPLAFIEHEVNGLICEPNSTSIAAAANRLLTEETLYSRLCQGAQDFIFDSTWDHVIERLTASLRQSSVSKVKIG